jgi:phosphatidylethanolamine-binding protein (PEBP) family uncharacterized protein
MKSLKKINTKKAKRSKKVTKKLKTKKNKQNKRKRNPHSNAQLDISNKVYVNDQFGGANQPILSITYGVKQLQNNPILLKKAETANRPTIKLNLPINIRKIMLIMYDKDAPNGENSSGNSNYMHMVEIYQNNKNYKLLQYTPPTPPYGTHNYIFELYDLNNKFNLTIPRGSAGTEYYKTISNLIQQNGVKLITNSLSFKVNSGKTKQ